MAKLFLIFCTICSISSAFQVIQIFDDEESAVFRTGSFFADIPLVIPGTNWCGAGNISSNNEDLGFFRDVDACCRSHDRCENIIHAGETKHGLTNPSLIKTRVSCECDHDFHQCLKNVKSYIFKAEKVGEIYFDYLRTKCFKLEHPYTCRKSRFGRCIDFEYKTDEPKLHQWFDVEFWN